MGWVGRLFFAIDAKGRSVGPSVRRSLGRSVAMEGFGKNA